MKRSSVARWTNRLDNKSPEPKALLVTLAGLKEQGRLVCVYCVDCHREKEVKPETIPLPLDTPVPTVGPRLKCSECGGRLQAKAQLSTLPIAELRERHR